MERHLIKQGKGGYTIYLPKAWVDQRGLTDKDKVILSESSDGLQISAPTKIKSHFSVFVDDSNQQYLSHILTHLYRTGIDSIELSGKIPHDIHKIVQENLLGFEVTTNDKKCIIENISEPSDEKNEQLLRRSWLIIKESLRLIMEKMRGKNIELQEAKNLMQQQQRIIFFCKRLITKQISQENKLARWELLSFLLYIEHHCYYFFEHLHNSKKKITKEELDLLNQTTIFFDLLYTAYYTKDLSKIYKLYEEKDRLYFELSAQLIENTKNPLIVSYLREIIRWINLASSSVFSIISHS